MSGVEFVTSAPDYETPPEAPEKRDKWTRSDLEAALGEASGHIRFLLHELAQSDSVPAKQLQSKPVAYAQVQRICNSRGKEALVTTAVRDGEKVYSLHPDYRADIAALVAGTTPPPPSQPKPPSARRPRGGRRQTMSALDGIADSRGTSLAPASSVAIPARRIAQAQSGRTLAIPPDISIEFCKELLGFVNATSSGTRYRIILEDDGYRLEAC